MNCPERDEILNLLKTAPSFRVGEDNQEVILKNLRHAARSAVRSSRKFRPFWAKSISISLTAIVVLLVGTFSVSQARDELWNVISKFRHSSNSGIITSIEFKGPNPNQPFSNFPLTKSDWNTSSLVELHTLCPWFPKLALPNWKIIKGLTGGQLNGGNRAQIVITASTPDRNIYTIQCYSGLTEEMIVDGTSVSPITQNSTVLNGSEVKYFGFDSDHGGIGYVIWKRGIWTIAISSNTANEVQLLQAAKFIDRQF